MTRRTLGSGMVALLAVLAGSFTANAGPIFASALTTSSNVTSFGSGLVTGAPDSGGLWLASTSDPPAQLGSLTVFFNTALGDGAGVDLTIFDVFSSANETFSVEVSSNNVAYTLIGGFSATNNGVDFNGMFGGPVSYVRLTNTSRDVFADIDALCGNYEYVPEPGTLALLSLVALGMKRRKLL